MIAYSYIEKNLKFLENRYAKSRQWQELSFLSKIAVIELCGWIEVSMDDIFYRFISKNLRDQKNIEDLKNSISNNYGFHYDRNFKKMIISCVGHHGFEDIQNSIDPQIIQSFKSELGSLSFIRNQLAHNYVKGTTAQFDSPTITLSRLGRISQGLKEYDTTFRRLS